MSKSNNRPIHVIYTDKKWKVEREKSEKSIKNFNTQKEAEDFGRKLSKKDNAELTIHKKDGKIQRKDSHGKDPYPPKG